MLPKEEYLDNKTIIKSLKNNKFRSKESMNDFSFNPEDRTYWNNKKMIYVRLSNDNVAHFYTNSADVRLRLRTYTSTRENVKKFIDAFSKNNNIEENIKIII